MPLTSASPVSITASRALSLHIGQGGGGIPDGQTLWGDYVVISSPDPNLWDVDLSTGDWSDTGPYGATFDLTGSEQLSLVTDEQYVLGSNNGIFAEPSGPIAGKDWEGNPFDGTHNAVRCSFAPASENNNPLSEYGFYLGDGNAYPRLCCKLTLRVPTNFEHVLQPEMPSSGTNNKLFRIWMFERNDAEGSTVGMEFRANADGTGSDWYLKYSEGGGVVGGDTDSVPFIDTERDRGRHMEIHIDIQAVSQNGQSDGHFIIHRRWQDESEFTKTHERTGLELSFPTDPTKPQGFTRGDFMGYQGSGYLERTDFLITGLKFSTEPMI